MTQKQLLSTINKNSSLTEIQTYIQKILEMRGFANEPIQDTMLLLLEEAGELAKAIRKSSTSMSVDVDKLHNYDTIESEVADIFIVLTAICNKTGINLFEALAEKELVNCERNWSFER